MSYIKYLIDFIVHIDVHLQYIISTYGLWTYLILFIIIFCETGLVVIPFLPGDSLVFVAGALAHHGSSMSIGVLYILFASAAILGDTANYHIGKFIGPKIFEKESTKFFNKENLMKTQHFYDKHGGKTIIIARFIPIIRTFAPFVAGIGDMSYLKFLSFNAIGGISWITLFLFAGYSFGNIPAVRKNFTLVIFAIIFISVLPAVFTYFNQKFSKSKQK